MDQNNLIVYLEIEDGKVADVSLELLTKGRVLAEKLGVKLEAVAVGDNLDRCFPTELTVCTACRTSVSRPIPRIRIRQCSSTCSKRSSLRYA